MEPSSLDERQRRPHSFPNTGGGSAPKPHSAAEITSQHAAVRQRKCYLHFESAKRWFSMRLSGPTKDAGLHLTDHGRMDYRQSRGSLLSCSGGDCLIHHCKCFAAKSKPVDSMLEGEVQLDAGLRFNGNAILCCGFIHPLSDSRGCSILQQLRTRQRLHRLDVTVGADNSRHYHRSLRL